MKIKDWVKRHPAWTVIIGVLIILVLASFSQDTVERELFVVTGVIDGDTIYIDNGEKVRLICIDTPEFGEGGYQEAKDYLEDLLLNKNIRIEKDISERDRYGRLLRYLYLEDGTFVNEKIVREGYAESFPYSPDTALCPAIQEAEDEARNNKLGIWKVEELEPQEPEVQPEPPTEQQSEEPAETGYICNSNAYNCPDFITHAEAQVVYEACGGLDNDIHQLDRDKDGLACESLP